LIADIWACFQGQSMGRFDDIDDITMFAGTLYFRMDVGVKLV
jgi:hypothetical protein